MSFLGRVVALGSRLSIVSIVSLSVFVAEQCGSECQDEECSQGGGGEAGQGGSGGDGGVGGDTVTGGGGAGAEGGQGGAGGEQAGGGGAGGVGGQGGAGGVGGGPCVPSFSCGPKNCGLVDDGCGTVLDCDATEGDPVTCQTQGGGTPGPMTCGAAHICECPAEGDGAAAMAKCGAQSDNPAVPSWCAENGGCHTRLCGAPPVAKSPENCLYGGGLQDGTQIWCCVENLS